MIPFFCGVEPAQRLVCSIEALWPALARLLLSSWWVGVVKYGGRQ